MTVQQKVFLCFDVEGTIWFGSSLILLLHLSLY